MFEIADRLVDVLGDAPAVATAIDVLGSSPHPMGTSMAVTADGRVIGSVSGGCVESAALHACAAVLAGGPVAVERFGFGDAAAVRAGLACGGELDVLVHRVDGPGVAAELRASLAGRPAAVAVVTAGSAPLLGAIVCGAEGAGAGEERLREVLGAPTAARVVAAVRARVAVGGTGSIEVECGETALRLFVEVAAPAARLVIAGATEVGRALAAAALAVGYRVTVCDARAAFAGADRVPVDVEVRRAFAHELIAAAPFGPDDAICVVSHDDDLDPLALDAALRSGAGYVGALGSRATHTARVERMRALGVPDDRIAALHAPIGLDIGASTPAETAVSILAEVIAARTGATGDPLRVRSGPIHRRRGARADAAR